MSSKNIDSSCQRESGGLDTGVDSWEGDGEWGWATWEKVAIFRFAPNGNKQTLELYL